jgi:transcriptional regulator with XRE-family HTH domain
MSRAPRPPQDLEILGHRLRAARMALDYSTGEFAASINVASNTYSQWETGARLLDTLAAIRLCERHKLSMDWFYRGDAFTLPRGIVKDVLTNFSKLTR